MYFYLIRFNLFHYLFSDPTVRDNSAEALGTLMKLVGEKAITPFLTDVDNLKMAKIKECCEKAVITAKIGAPKKERPLTAPPKVVVSGGAPKAGSAAPKPVKRPNSSGKAKVNLKGECLHFCKL